MSLTVAQIMTPDPPALHPQDPVERVVELLHEHRLSGLPVVGEDGRPVGIVTENDLLMSDAADDLHAPPNIQVFGGVIFLGSVKHWEERVRKAIASSVGDVMTRDPVTVRSDATPREAAHLISSGGHNRLPVVDGDGLLVGVVTRADVLDALLDER